MYVFSPLAQICCFLVLSTSFDKGVADRLSRPNAGGRSGGRPVYVQQPQPAMDPAFMAMLQNSQANNGQPPAMSSSVSVVTVPIPGLVDGFAGSKKKRTISGGFGGMIGDFMGMISVKAELDFTMTAEAEFGIESPYAPGKFTGAIGKVASGEKEMIAAALEPDSSYQTGVDFSVPFLQSKVHIIYTAQHGLNEKSTKIAIMANTATRRWLERSKNAAHQRLWEKISSNPGSLVTTYKDGMDLLNSGANWAFIGRTPAIDNTVIQSNGKLIKHPKVWRTVYGCLGLKKDSPYLAKVNSAISMLQDEGLLDKLLEKHFPNSTLSVCPTVTPNTMAPHVPTATILTTTTTPPPLF